MKKIILIVCATLTVVAIGCSEDPGNQTDPGGGVTEMEIDTDAGE